MTTEKATSYVVTVSGLKLTMVLKDDYDKLYQEYLEAQKTLVGIAKDVGVIDSENEDTNSFKERYE